MPEAAPKAVHRADYRVPDYRIDRVDLHFDLGEDETVVRAQLALWRAPDADPDAPLVLHGEELELRALRLDGRALAPAEYTASAEALVIPRVPARFELETEVAIRPQDNTALSGLYKSAGNFCTQCEAEGFRRITYYLDRPDIMAAFTTTIEADRAAYPVLLSNGNREAEGDDQS